MTYATVVRRPAAACFGSRSFGQRPHIPGRSAQPPPRRSSAAKEGRPQAAAAWRQRLSHKSLCKGLRQQPVGRAASDAKLFDLQVG
jgi:hypothetical protein